MIKQLEDLVNNCEILCDLLRKMRRENSNQFFDSPEEKLLKNIDGALTGYYRGGVDEPRELTRMKYEQQELYKRINELENELATFKTN